jgi:imidazolonepropionase-like amidohydrolase
MRSALVILSLVVAVDASAACTVYHNADLYISGVPTSGQQMVIVDGAIKAIVSDDEAVIDCLRVDLDGAVVTPGFIEVGTKLGLVEIGLEASSVDHIGGGDGVNHSSLVVGEAYNPRSSLIAIARAGGITTAVVAPSGGLVSGQSALVTLHGTTQAQAVLDWSVAMHAGMHWSGSRASGLQQLRGLFAEAKLLSDSPTRWRSERAHHADSARADIQAMIPIIEGKKPLVISASRAADIEALLRLIAPYSIQLIIQGGAEAWVHADALANANVGVIIDPMSNGAGGFSDRLGRADNAAILDKAGVTVVFTTSDTHNARNLRFAAGNAVRAGLPHAAAMRAITSNPAKLYGQPEMGDLIANTPATFAVWSADPFEPLSHLQSLFINGEQVSISSRQTELYRRYSAE